MKCPCPYVPCELRGNCSACVSKNRAEGSMINCMEKTAMHLGAKLPARYPRTVVCDDQDGMSATCARMIADAVRAKPDALLCLPAGNSAVGTYQALKQMADAGEADFSRARFVQLDEWLDLADESENCSAFLEKHFYGPLCIRKTQIRAFDLRAEDMNAECHSVDQYIFDNGPIDFMLLGLGMNGHLGLNEPGMSWDHYAMVVELSDTTKQVGQKYFTSARTLTRGVTLGMHHVFDAEQVVLQVSGASKADIVEAVYEAQPDIELPGTVMKLLKNACVVLDRYAASKLEHLV